VTINIEAKWNAMNIIKTSSLEPAKNYLTISLGVFF
jgi:hypothetical protein